MNHYIRQCQVLKESATKIREVRSQFFTTVLKVAVSWETKVYDFSQLIFGHSHKMETTMDEFSKFDRNVVY